MCLDLGGLFNCFLLLQFINIQYSCSEFCPDVTPCVLMLSLVSWCDPLCPEVTPYVLRLRWPFMSRGDPLCPEVTLCGWQDVKAQVLTQVCTLLDFEKETKNMIVVLIRTLLWMDVMVDCRSKALEVLLLSNDTTINAQHIKVRICF